MISSKEIKEIKHKPNTRIRAKVSSTHLFNYVITFYMDMGIAQRYIIKGSRLKVIKTTFNLNSWIKKFEKSKKKKKSKKIWANYTMQYWYQRFTLLIYGCL